MEVPKRSSSATLFRWKYLDLCMMSCASSMRSRTKQAIRTMKPGIKTRLPLELWQVWVVSSGNAVAQSSLMTFSVLFVDSSWVENGGICGKNEWLSYIRTAV